MLRLSYLPYSTGLTVFKWVTIDGFTSWPITYLQPADGFNARRPDFGVTNRFSSASNRVMRPAMTIILCVLGRSLDLLGGSQAPPSNSYFDNENGYSCSLSFPCISTDDSFFDSSSLCQTSSQLWSQISQITIASPTTPTNIASQYQPPYESTPPIIESIPIRCPRQPPPPQIGSPPHSLQHNTTALTNLVSATHHSSSGINSSCDPSLSDSKRCIIYLGLRMRGLRLIIEHVHGLALSRNQWRRTVTLAMEDLYHIKVSRSSAESSCPGVRGGLGPMYTIDPRQR